MAPALSLATAPASPLAESLLWVVIVGNIWGVIHYFLAARTLREDLTAKER